MNKPKRPKQAPMSNTWTTDKSLLNSLDKRPVASSPEAVRRKPPPYLLEIWRTELPKSPLSNSLHLLELSCKLELHWVRTRDLVVSHMLNSELMLRLRKQ